MLSFLTFTGEKFFRKFLYARAWYYSSWIEEDCLVSFVLAFFVLRVRRARSKRRGGNTANIAPNFSERWGSQIAKSMLKIMLRKGYFDGYPMINELDNIDKSLLFQTSPNGWCCEISKGHSMIFNIFSTFAHKKNSYICPEKWGKKLFSRLVFWVVFVCIWLWQL